MIGAAVISDRRPKRAYEAEPALVETDWALLDVDAGEELRFAALLTHSERQRACEYRRPADRRRYLVRRGKLRALLAACLGCMPREVPLAYNDFGKPCVAGSDLRFNLSHSCGLAFYAIATGFDLGCDIEWRRPRLATKEVAAQFFSKRERTFLAAVPQSQWVEAFFNCWTRKEALAKGLGLGVSYPLQDFDVSVAPGEPAALLRGPSGWSLRSFAPLPGLHLAIAANQPRWRVTPPTAPALR